MDACSFLNRVTLCLMYCTYALAYTHCMHVSCHSVNYMYRIYLYSNQTCYFKFLTKYMAKTKLFLLLSPSFNYYWWPIFCQLFITAILCAQKNLGRSLSLSIIINATIIYFSPGRMDREKCRNMHRDMRHENSSAVWNELAAYREKCQELEWQL